MLPLLLVDCRQPLLPAANCRPIAGLPGTSDPLLPPAAIGYPTTIPAKRFHLPFFPTTIPAKSLKGTTILIQLAQITSLFKDPSFMEQLLQFFDSKNKKTNTNDEDDSDEGDG
ncbi:hypothetical protein R6Q59_016509 [Mikania micrantha]